MRAKSYVESSIILLNNNKYEEALCLLCCAINGCANEKYNDINGVFNKISKWLNDYLYIISEKVCPSFSEKTVALNSGRT